MGVRIQELPETTGINKEDVLIVEDGQGTKKGTVQQLDEALGVSQLKEDLTQVSDNFNEYKTYNLLNMNDENDLIADSSIKNWNTGTTTMNDIKSGVSGTYVYPIISVKPNTRYRMVYKNHNYANCRAIGFYDIDGVSISYSSVSGNYNTEILTPDNCYYVRFDRGDNAVVMFEEIIYPTDYVRYGIVVPKTDLTFGENIKHDIATNIVDASYNATYNKFFAITTRVIRDESYNGYIIIDDLNLGENIKIYGLVYEIYYFDSDDRLIKVFDYRTTESSGYKTVDNVLYETPINAKKVVINFYTYLAQTQNRWIPGVQKYKNLFNIITSMEQPILPYWKEYIDSKSSDIINSIEKDSLIFAFITDVHSYFGVKKLGTLLKYCDDKIGFDYILDGGDEAFFFDDKSVYLQDVYDAIYDLRQVKEKIIPCVGNHEQNYNNTSGQNVTNDEIYSILFRHLSKDIHYINDKFKYYFDDTSKKIRWFVIEFGGVTETEATTIGNRIDELGEGWQVGVLTHCSECGENGNLYHVLDAKRNTHPCIGVFGGHTHRDNLTNYGNITLLTTTSDARKNRTNDAYEGTLKEHAFDIVVVNRTSRTVVAHRIGGYQNADGYEWDGTSRTWNY